MTFMRLLKSNNWACLAIIASVFVFFTCTIRSGQPWPDDFAMYVHEAENIVHHVPISRTGYIYDPYNPSLGPRAYPPLFPLLLAPGYAIGGIENLKPLKFEIVLCFVCLLMVLWLTIGSTLPPTSRAAFLAIVGFSPVLWNYKDFITSDIPFTFLLYLTLAVVDRPSPKPCSGRAIALSVAVSSALIYVCYGMRAMGIVLVPSLIVLAILNWRRGGRWTAMAAGIALIPCVIQSRLFGGEESYLDQLRLGPVALVRTLLKNAVTYTWSLATFWNTPYSHIIRNIVFVCVSILALLAYSKRVRSGPRIYEIFVPAYLALVLVWPNPGGDRYLIPLFPLYIFYMLEGIGIVSQSFRIRQPEIVLASVIVTIAILYGSEFMKADYGPFQDGIANSQTQQMFAFVRSDTKSNDIFVFRRPRAFALYTGRNAAVYPEPEHAGSFASYFRSIGATYLIEAPALDDADFDAFVEKSCLGKQLVFSNSDFRVFRLDSSSLACDASARRIAQVTSP